MSGLADWQLDRLVIANCRGKTRPEVARLLSMTMNLPTPDTYIAVKRLVEGRKLFYDKNQLLQVSE